MPPKSLFYVMLCFKHKYQYCFKHKYQYYHDIQFVIEGFKESIDKHMHTSERKQLVMSIFKKVLLFQVNLGKLVFWSMKKYALTSIS